MKEAFLRYVPEKNLQKEGLRKVGVGLFIVDLNSEKLWVVEEKCQKNGPNGTGREIGDVTIPLETRKSGEYILDNVLGGLAEFRQLCEGEELIFLNKFSYLGRQELITGVAADLVMIGLKHRCSDEIMAVDNEEVCPRGWMDIEELRQQHNLRKGVAQFLDLLTERKIISQFVQESKDPNNCGLVMTGSIVMNEVYQRREVKTDWENVPCISNDR